MNWDYQGFLPFFHLALDSVPLNDGQFAVDGFVEGSHTIPPQGKAALFRITRNIWQGPFASHQRLNELRRLRITHIVNVGESPNQLSETDGPFKRLAWTPIEDLVLIPTSSAIHCVDTLHECVCADDGNVYLHCVAGWNRSPTILWLYMVACGIGAETAKSLIATSSYDSVPAHPKLVDKTLVDAIMKHGAKHFRPHPRPTALEAVDLPKRPGER